MALIGSVGARSAVVGVVRQEVDTRRIGEAAGCSCSAVGGSKRIDRFGAENGFWRGNLGSSCRLGFCFRVSRLLTTKIGNQLTIVRGVNGTFWEGADSESTANVDYPAQSETLRQKEGSVLASLIQEIEPLDVSLISKDASSDSTDAMKRTISGMLGLLPSDQFQVTIGTLPDHLARLLVSSMMTGYTLRNAEYRLCLQRSLDLENEDVDRLVSLQVDGIPSHGLDSSEPLYENISPDRCGEQLEPPLPDTVSPEVAKYVQHLQAKLTAASKELDRCKHALSALEIVGQEKNDLLDYLRSLEPEKVAELSHPTSSEVHEVVHQVVNGILSTLYPKEPPPIPPFGTSISHSWKSDGVSEVISNVPLKFQSTVTSARDYLARLLFWCMLLGYHMRGLEYRLELSRTLSLSGEVGVGAGDRRE